jgi:hypothetical protein
MPSFPTPYEPSTEPPVSAPFDLRYDDLTQHGHIKLSTLHLVLGRVCFDKVWTRHPLFETRRQGVFPILSRMVLEADPVAVSFTAPLDGRGRVEVAHERDAQGQVSALFLNAYGEIWGLRSRRQPGSESHRVQSDRAAGAGSARSSAPLAREPVRVGRAFGEHVLTKPFGPAAERKTLRLEVPGQAAIPAALHTRLPVAEALVLPASAQPLDADFEPDTAPWVFGLVHTDANQHVNSLVYVRAIEEAAVRRLTRHGQPARAIGTRIEINYRKPCFAGETLHCMLRSALGTDGYTVSGYLVADGAPPERAHCSFRLLLRQVPH